MILSNPSASAVELVELVMKEFGVASVKEEAKARQKSAMENACVVPANAGIVQAFQELGDYYFKEGNSNAGLTVSRGGGFYGVFCVSNLHCLFSISTRRPSLLSLVSTMKSQLRMHRVSARAGPNSQELVKAPLTRSMSTTPLVRIVMCLHFDIYKHTTLMLFS
jgi:hypothetical protein